EAGRKLARGIRQCRGDLFVFITRRDVPATNNDCERAPIQRCQVHKARNILERLPKPLHASVRKALRQAWELDDAEQSERLSKNLARRLEQQAPGIAASILEGLDEILTVIRLGLPAELRRSLACTNIIENMMG